jgi:carboxyl-terminal processing protease
MVEVALDELIDQGATTILVDLQNNPGGSLVAAVEIASQFLADGDVVRTEAPDDTETYGVRRGGVAVDPGIRIVVLLNRGSASASEVVAAVLQERGRATVMGEASYGKNTVQQQYGLSNGGALKLTVARWLTPGGHDFGGTGVTPDVAVNIPDDAEEDYLVEKSLALINS